MFKIFIFKKMGQEKEVVDIIDDDYCDYLKRNVFKDMVLVWVFVFFGVVDLIEEEGGVNILKFNMY